MKTKLPAQTAARVFDAADSLGINRQQLLDAVGLEGEISEGVQYQQLASLYEAAARAAGDPSFGLKVGEASSPKMYGVLGHLVVNNSTLGAALEAVAAFQRIWSSAVGFSLSETRSSTTLRYWHKPFLAPECRRHESEQMLASVICLLRDAAAAPLRPNEVRFEHPAPADTARHAQIFDCAVRFNSPATEISFSQDSLEVPLAGSDPLLRNILKQEAERELVARVSAEDIVDQVRLVSEAAILTGRQPALADIAASLGKHARTVQRHLQSRGLSFRQVQHSVQMDLAKRLLRETRLPLSEVAYRLGFSRSAAFHRAFRREAGRTPGDFRRNLGLAAPIADEPRDRQRRHASLPRKGPPAARSSRRPIGPHP